MIDCDMLLDNAVITLAVWQCDIEQGRERNSNMSNNILILKCSLLHFHTSKEYKKYLIHLHDQRHACLQLLLYLTGTKYCFWDEFKMWGHIFCAKHWCSSFFCAVFSLLPPYPKVIVPFLRPVLIVTLNAIVFRNLEPNGADRTLDLYKNCCG